MCDSMWLWQSRQMVPGAGIEPARLAAGDFESPASTNFTTRAGLKQDGNYGTVQGMTIPDD
jgi:hypothetical protein